jgi:hypothetical protein
VRLPFGGSHIILIIAQVHAPRCGADGDRWKSKGGSTAKANRYSDKRCKNSLDSKSLPYGMAMRLASQECRLACEVLLDLREPAVSMMWSAKNDPDPGAPARSSRCMPYDRLPLLSMRAMLPGHENCSKPWTGPAANARPTSGMLRCPDSMLKEMHAATEPITRRPGRIHDRGSTGRMC